MFRLIWPVILRSESSLRQRLRRAGDEESLTLKDHLDMRGTLPAVVAFGRYGGVARYVQSDKITERIYDNRYKPEVPGFIS